MGVASWAKNLVLDSYANLTYKRAFESPRRYAGTWVPDADLRRIISYRILAAYRENVAREHIPSGDAAERLAHREYGDAELIVHRVVAGVLGDDVQIVVDGADADPPDVPLLPPRPQQPAADADEVDRRVFDAAVRVWEQRAADTVADWERTWADLPGLRERQQWLRDWADSELLEQALWEAETDTVCLGDGVFALEVSTEERRVKLDVYDPGFYFPVLDEDARRRGFPTTVHVAFELDLNGDGVSDHVRRITWELGLIVGQADDAGVLLADADGRLVPLQGDQLNPDGYIVRQYPWAPAGEVSFVTCYKTDATWRLDDIAGTLVGDFPLDRAQFAVNEDGTPMRRLDLRQDFLPVVHVPNTPSRRDHFGRSTLGRVLQLLDDLADTDSDIQSAASLAGLPMIGVSGVGAPASMVVRPGAVFGLGENGRMDTIDLSGPLKALLELKGELEDRLGVNVQVPGEVTGRVEDTGPESGFARSLKLGPFSSLIGLLRLVREPKGRLLLKQVQRMSQAAGFLPPGPTMVARLAFGSFLPSDRKQAIDEVIALLKDHVISLQTGLQMLVDVGVTIDDINEEIARVHAEDTESALQATDATDDPDVGREWLGLPPSTRLPEPVLPPVPTPPAPPPAA